MCHWTFAQGNLVIVRRLCKHHYHNYINHYSTPHHNYHFEAFKQCNLGSSKSLRCTPLSQKNIQYYYKLHHTRHFLKDRFRILLHMDRIRNYRSYTKLCCKLSHKSNCFLTRGTNNLHNQTHRSNNQRTYTIYRNICHQFTPKSTSNRIHTFLN